MRLLPMLAFCLTPALVSAQGAVPFDMPPDLAEARQSYLRQSYDIWHVISPYAQSGHPVALNLMGVAYGEPDRSKGLDYDPQKAMDFLTRAVDAGSVRALHNLAIFWGEAHVGFGPDFSRKRDLAQQAIDAGYVHAHTLIGDLHFNGNGVAQDKVVALEHYRRAADLGSFVGLRKTGNAYYNGDGTAPDAALARVFLERAAMAGDALALIDLAWLYEGNDGTAQDLLKSYLLYQRAIALGQPRAHYELGLFMAYDGYQGFWHDPVQGLGHCLYALQRGYDTSDNSAAADCAALEEDMDSAAKEAAHAFAKSLGE